MPKINATGLAPTRTARNISSAAGNAEPTSMSTSGAFTSVTDVNMKHTILIRMTITAVSAVGKPKVQKRRRGRSTENGARNQESSQKILESLVRDVKPPPLNSLLHL